MRTNIVRTPFTRALDMIQWHLEQISPDNNFIGGPIVVNRTLDPRLVRTDQAKEFREKLFRVTLKPADAKLLKSTASGMRGTLGGVKRYWRRIEMICNYSLGTAQDEAGITLDMVAEWFRLDFSYNCLWDIDVQGRPTFITKAAAALAASDPNWGPPPSFINPQVTEILHGPALSFPNAVFVMRLEFMQDEPIRSFAQPNL